MRTWRATTEARAGECRTHVKKKPQPFRLDQYSRSRDGSTNTTSPAAPSRTAASWRGGLAAGFPGIRRRRPTWRAISARTIDATRRRGGSSQGSRSSVAVRTRPCAMRRRSAESEPTTISCRLPCVSRSRWSGFADPDGNTRRTSSNRSKSSADARWMRSGFLCRRAAARASRRSAADPSNHPAPRSSRRTSRKPRAAAERRLDPTSTWSRPIRNTDGLRSSGRAA